MTDITLEQRALLAALEMAVMQNSHDMLMTGEQIRQCEHAMRQYREALRLSAGADVNRLLAAWYEQGIRQGMRVQSPGHAHDRPGIWDDDNGKLAGVECAACALWKIAAQIAAAPRHEPGEG